MVAAPIRSRGREFIFSAEVVLQKTRLPQQEGANLEGKSLRSKGILK